MDPYTDVSVLQISTPFDIEIGEKKQRRYTLNEIIENKVFKLLKTFKNCQIARFNFQKLANKLERFKKVANKIR